MQVNVLSKSFFLIVFKVGWVPCLVRNDRETVGERLRNDPQKVNVPPGTGNAFCKGGNMSPWNLDYIQLISLQN